MKTFNSLFLIASIIMFIASRNIATSFLLTAAGLITIADAVKLLRGDMHE